MGFTVKDMLDSDELSGSVEVLGGAAGLANEIQGATIIEAPDIVKFISGGEVLLTGFYAFQSCSVEEFKAYIKALSGKKVSALAVKRGREVEYIEEKMTALLDFAEEQSVPVLEIPFEMSFRDVMKFIMERLFNEEVVRLKYFKSTHDNFTALSLSFKSAENGVQRILDVLEKLIGNPAALFNQNMDCLGTTDERLSQLTLSEGAKEYQPQFYSNYTYLKQQTALPLDKKTGYTQYLVKINVMYNTKMYLAVTELNHSLGSMDYIPIDNAVTALKQELFRQYSMAELEKKFQNDVMNNILNGKLRTRKEMEREAGLLGIPLDANYRVLVLGLSDTHKGEIEELGDKMNYASALYDAVAGEFRGSWAQKDMAQIVVIQQMKPGQKQEIYRKELKESVARIQKKMYQKNKRLRVRAGVGKETEGLMTIAESFKEAEESLEFIDILGETNTDNMSRIMVFSDMGIFRLLCKLDSPELLFEYIPESLQKLYNYKKQHRQDLIITLSTYLERNQNLTRTAQDLYIHYKTAAYRIERIAEITGIDFDNPNEVLAVRIGLVVYKMLENLKK